ncbi:MAG: Alpha/beta hydrolase family protein [Planctomycetes bacterium ADurb.Bin126]|nr:MAG: Alpha/beta hydrolase family protein [Planctomycetes bacterium ADurb.Bin126]HOD80554.1 hypothetical protein [Phycisphaerae bacterium]HQL72395.1 hypothetical protein [Phycisphaerae bacterium]
MNDRAGGTSWPRKIAKAVLAGLYGLWLLLTLPLALYLLIAGQTLGGRVDGGLLACLLALPPALYLRRRRHNALTRGLAGTIITFALALAILAVGLALPRQVAPPQGVKQPASYQPGIYGGRACSRFVGSSGKVVSLLSNLLPEVEQVGLAARVMGRLDKHLDREQLDQASRALVQTYQAMAREETLGGVSSSLALSYAAAAGIDSLPSHYFLYVPRNRRPAPMPVLVFLHDLPGNLKAHLWALSHLSEQVGCVVIAPTLAGARGSGDQPRTVRTVMAALEDASKLVDVDAGRVLLAGSGAGAASAAAVLRSAGDRFCALALIAPCPQEAGDLSPGRGRPLLLLCGQADSRLPAEQARQWAGQLRSSGLDVQDIHLPSQGRFLLFTAPNETVSALADWLRRTNDPGQG